MKTTSVLNHNIITGTICAGAVLFMAASASAQALYESDYYTGAINKFNSSGTATTVLSSSTPVGWQLGFNGDGYLFVGNSGGTSLTEVSPNGTHSSFGSGFNQPRGVAVDAAGNVFVSNVGSGAITEVSPNGSSQMQIASIQGNAYFLGFNNGNLFASDWSNGNIYKIVNGTPTVYASGFTMPTGFVFNTAGDLFVANSLNNDQGYISEVTPSGTSTILSGLNDPQGLAIDNSGNLYIAIAGDMTGAPNGEIEEYTSTGTAETFSTQVNTPESVDFSPVPEPSTLALLVIGASVAALRMRRME